ncbi:MAG TPA: carboxypeptidase-like regulatory domain-containing protein [Terracidiphilus sp.]
MSGAALPGVTVNTLDTNNNVAQDTTTGPDKDYRGVNLKPATYGMTGTADGDGSMKQEVPLLLGTDQTVNFAA